MVLKINSKDRPPEPWIEIDLKQFTIVNYDSMNGYSGEVRLTEEQARIIIDWMHRDYDSI